MWLVSYDNDVIPKLSEEELSIYLDDCLGHAVMDHPAVNWEGPPSVIDLVGKFRTLTIYPR